MIIVKCVICASEMHCDNSYGNSLFQCQNHYDNSVYIVFVCKDVITSETIRKMDFAIKYYRYNKKENFRIWDETCGKLLVQLTIRDLTPDMVNSWLLKFELWKLYR